MLREEFKSLEKSLSTVYDDHKRASIELDSVTSMIAEDKDTLVLSEMLPEYEEYYERTFGYHSRFDCQLLDEEYDASNKTIALEYLTEYLVTLVGTCNRNHYDYLKTTYVADCGCSGGEQTDAYYHEGFQTDDYYHEGFQLDDNRCSHGRKMTWIDDEDWDTGHAPTVGIMYDTNPHELRFTIHSEIPPGSIEYY